MRDWKLLLSITRTHLFSRIKQSTVAALGVTFGIGTFIVLVSFMTGLNDLLDGLVLNRTPHIHIFNEIKPSPKQPIELLEKYRMTFNVVHSIKPKTSLSSIHNAKPLIQQLRKDSRVKGVTPQVNATIFYLAGTIQLNGLVKGVDPTEETRLFSFEDYIVNGSADGLLTHRNGILIGAGVADKLSLQVGDRIQIMTPSADVFPLKIVGIFQSGLAEIDIIQSYVNLNTAQQLLGKGRNYITDINVKLKDMELAKSMSTKIEQQFGLTAIDIKTANAQFETGTSIRNIITYAVSVTLLIVAGFGIYNILNMLIFEKMNDIAILKATGFSGKDVQAIFISQAIIIGVVGGIFGLVLGYVLSVAISYTSFDTEALPTIKTYPVNFDPLFYIIGIGFAIISTFLAGYLPSIKAKKIDPVEIIRGQ